MEKNKKGFSASTLIITIIVLLALVFYALALRNSEPSLELEKSPSGYHAVFLLTNQVYFGQISKIDQSSVILEEPFYLQINNASQTEQLDLNSPEQEIPDLQLIRRALDLHGPTERMIINVDNVTLLEALREDSSVVQAIRESEANN